MGPRIRANAGRKNRAVFRSAFRMVGIIMMTGGLCLSKTSKCLSGWELYCSDSSFFRCSFLLRHSAPCSIFRSQAALRLENLALRHQIGVLQGSAGKRGAANPDDLSFHPLG